MKHFETHPVYVDGCFSCKISGVTFGVVPGAFKDTNSTSMFDREQVMSQLGHADGAGAFDKQRIQDMQSDFAKHQKEFLDAEV